MFNALILLIAAAVAAWLVFGLIVGVAWFALAWGRWRRFGERQRPW